MPKSTKRPARTIFEMQHDAAAYGLETFKNTPFHMDGIPEEQFQKIAGAIVHGLVAAWAAGYSARNEEKSR